MQFFNAPVAAGPAPVCFDDFEVYMQLIAARANPGDIYSNTFLVQLST
jgi:hypothetical protein